MSCLTASFAEVADPRTGNAKRHDFLEVLTIALTAAVCGAEHCSDFADFGEAVAAGGGDGVRLGHAHGDRATGLSRRRGRSEILAARALLECLDLSGQLVTADAIHCRNETAQVIIDRGGDYLLRLKDNRPALAATVVEYFADQAVRSELSAAETTDDDHGRIEVRRALVSHDLVVARTEAGSGRLGASAWAGLLGMIGATVTREGKTSVTRHYHLSSRPLSAEAYLVAARAHWSIENSLHWVLDMSFDEDRARNRKDNGPENLAILRKLALNTLKRARPGISIRRKRKRSGWSNDLARSILGQMR